MKALNQDTRAFVERMGLLMERVGAARTFGRLLGLLLVAEEPLSLDELARLLHVSKASISTNTRLCEQTGLAQRVSIPGDRRNYYEISPASFGRVLEARLPIIHEMVGLAEEGLQAIDADNEAARSRLQEMRDFYVFVGEEMVAMLAHWKAHKRSGTRPD